MNTPRSITLGSILFATSMLNSCSIIGLRQHVETLEQRGGVTFQVTPPPKGKVPTYALAWRMENGQRKDSAGFQQIRADGIASFNLRLDSIYQIGAFTDENGNRAYDAGEPLAVQPDVKPVSLSDPNALPKIWKLTLTRDHGIAAGTVIELPKENMELGGKINFSLGDVVSLDENRFAEDAGSGGLWRPLDFLSGNSLGIYFTEPYDAKRIPVVLVYGIGGSPQDWRYFIGHLDRKRYQLWFYHYPSGMRLNRAAGALASGLQVLKHRHGFSKCNVVAHSMGGLVARAAINQAVAAEGVNFIPEFVSISTPWGGHKGAESGVRHLKKPVPSWIDVNPGSDFLLKLYATPLPRGTRHDMIYGSIEDGPFWIKEENDGVVTVGSEMDSRIVRSSASTKFYTREHVEILNQPETVAYVNGLLSR
ncbi:MAG: alpha/beta fold hydrolase [Luteolibacter sp.]